MGKDRPYWNMKIEPLLNTPEMEKIQFKKLKKMLARMKANAPFYTRLFDQTRLEPERLRGFDEFKDKVKLFDKADLRQLVIDSGGDILKAIEQIMPVSVDELDVKISGPPPAPPAYPRPIPSPISISMSSGAKSWRVGPGGPAYAKRIGSCGALPCPW